MQQTLLTILLLWMTSFGSSAIDQALSQVYPGGAGRVRESMSSVIFVVLIKTGGSIQYPEPHRGFQ
jgi:hypothetical protein